MPKRRRVTAEARKGLWRPESRACSADKQDRGKNRHLDEAGRSLRLATRRCRNDALRMVNMRNIPGQKTDQKDCEWISDLLAHGLLRPSFVPPWPIRRLRDLTRYRIDLVGVRTAEKNRVEKLLEACIKLSVVASDIFGVSGRAMMAALIAGERDPKVLAQLARSRMRAKIGRLEESFRTSRRLAEAYYNVGSYTLALQECEVILLREPNSPEILALQGEIENKLQLTGQKREVGAHTGLIATDLVAGGANGASLIEMPETRHRLTHDDGSGRRIFVAGEDLARSRNRRRRVGQLGEIGEGLAIVGHQLPTLFLRFIDPMSRTSGFCASCG
jgi:hypothetical protein